MDKSKVIEYLRNNKIIIYLESLISAGKSTLCKSCDFHINNEGIKFRHYQEPINMKLLELFYSNIKKYAFPFQSIVIRERVHINNSAFEFLKDSGNLCIIDRSCFGDCAFALMHHSSGNISDKEFEVYGDLIKTPLGISKDEKVKEYVVYLHSTPEKCRERVVKRGNFSEIENCNIEYLTGLEKNYNKVLYRKDTSQLEESVLNTIYEGIGDIKILNIDYNEDLEIVDGKLSESNIWGILGKIIEQIEESKMN